MQRAAVPAPPLGDAVGSALVPSSEEARGQRGGGLPAETDLVLKEK